MKPLASIAVCLSCVLIAGSGCASIAAHNKEPRNARAYPGVRDDAYFLTHPHEADMPVIQWLCIFDLPFSALIDTILLPGDLAAPHDQDVQERVDK